MNVLELTFQVLVFAEETWKDCLEIRMGTQGCIVPASPAISRRRDPASSKLDRSIGRLVDWSIFVIGVIGRVRLTFWRLPAPTLLQRERVTSSGHSRSHV